MESGQPTVQEALEAVGVTLENKIKTRELDRKIKEDYTKKIGNNLLTLQQENPTNDKISESVSQRDDRSQVARNGRMEEAIIRLRSSSSSRSPIGDGAQSPISGQELEARTAESYAQESGIWIPLEDVFRLGVPGPSGNKNDTYFSSDGYVYKVNNLMNSGGIVPLLDRLLLHNQTFPETTYELIGFTGFSGRSISPVFRQRAIVNPHNATKEEIDSYMTALGFHKTEDWQYENEDLVISDLRPRNVLNSESGHIYVVDAEFSRKVPIDLSHRGQGKTITQSSQTGITRHINQGQFGLVSDERMTELKERLRKKLGGQMNIGIDPEILAIGLEIAVGHLDRGVKTFTDFAKVMIADMGDAIRPYLKAFYNGARELPEVVENGLASDMTSYDEVQSFDVANFDKQGIDAFATAETVTREAEVAQEVEVAQERIKKTRSAKKETKKKSVNLQQSGELGLFDSLFEETPTVGDTRLNESNLSSALVGTTVDHETNNDNGLQRIDATRSEGVSANGNRHEQGLSRGTETGSESEQQGSRGTDYERETTGDAVDRTVRPRLSDTVTEPKNTRNNHSERGYNLMEIYSDRKGNLTAKNFYKSKEGVSQRVISLTRTLHTTSETDGATLNDGAKIPQMFETPSVEDNYSREGVGSYTDDEVSIENDPISKVYGVLVTMLLSQLMNQR